MSDSSSRTRLSTAKRTTAYSTRIRLPFTTALTSGVSTGTWATSQAATFVDWKQMPPSYERFRPEFETASKSYHLVEHLSLHADHKAAVSDEFTRTVAIAGDEVAMAAPTRPILGNRITFSRMLRMLA